MSFYFFRIVLPRDGQRDKIFSGIFLNERINLRQNPLAEWATHRPKFQQHDLPFEVRQTILMVINPFERELRRFESGRDGNIFGAWLYFQTSASQIQLNDSQFFYTHNKWGR